MVSHTPVPIDYPLGEEVLDVGGALLEGCPLAFILVGGTGSGMRCGLTLASRMRRKVRRRVSGGRS